MNMTPDFEPGDDLDALLQSHRPAIADNDFSQSVLRQMKRSRKQRFFILGALGLIGALLTAFLFPSGEMVASLANTGKNIETLGAGNLAISGIIAAGLVWFLVEEA